MLDIKPTNPKDSIGIRKWRYLSTVPMTVMWEVGAALLEGARKYGRHNYRVAGVRASVYVDAAMGHIGQWWEGEDIDKDSGISHITKAIASLIVVRDAMIQDMLTDDRPPKGKLDQVRADLQAAVDAMFEKYPEPKAAFTEKDRQQPDMTRDELKSIIKGFIDAGQVSTRELANELYNLGCSSMKDLPEARFQEFLVRIRKIAEDML